MAYAYSAGAVPYFGADLWRAIWLGVVKVSRITRLLIVLLIILAVMAMIAIYRWLAWTSEGRGASVAESAAAVR